ncbi:MAG: chemotaxis protein CheW [Leptolyngbyaceae bacterium]|nr:chemotaxis protein CheW [Leptolyngbyaceae bacterium]
MAISTSSLLRSRRSAARRAEATQQLIVFPLKQEWFALPIPAVQKVVALGKVYGDPQKTGVSLTNYQDKELVVIDVGQRIFKQSTPPGSGTADALADQTQRYLVILQSSQGDLIGLPIDGQPTLRRIPVSAFGPLPPAYRSEGNIQCISSVMIQPDQEAPFFLLDPDQLVRSGG